MRLHIAKPEHYQLEALAKFYHDVWHETHAPLQDPRIATARKQMFFANRLNTWWHGTLIGWSGSDITGFASVDGAMLEALFVAPHLRSGGIGSQLLSASESLLSKSGAEHFSLDCVRANLAGRKFYERHGWRVSATADHPDDNHPDIVTSHWIMVKSVPFDSARSM